MNKKKALKILDVLITKGKKLNKQCESVKRSNFHNSRKYEQLGSAWYIQCINFLSTNFGPKSIQVRKFASYFNVYNSTNLLGMYGGTTHFVKEDVQKAVGHLEGINESLSNGYLNRINPFFRAFYKFWLELKELLGFIRDVLTRKN